MEKRIYRLCKDTITPNAFTAISDECKIECIENALGKKRWEIPLYDLVNTIRQTKVLIKRIRG